MSCVVDIPESPRNPSGKCAFPGRGVQAQVLPSVIQRVVAGGW